MKKVIRVLVVFTGIVILIWACTNKEINLVTNVDLEFEQTTTSEGFVNELLPTTLTITPEAFLPEFEYFFEYIILEGQGVFFNAEEEALPNDEKIILTKEENATNFLLNLNYQPTISGIHRIQVTASDNFEKALTSILTYSVKDLDIIWEASTAVTTTPPATNVPITVILENISNDPGLTFEWRYRYISGSGTLTDMEGAAILSNQFNPITPDNFIFNALPNEEGVTTLIFDVRDSNGQIVSREVSFEVSLDALSDDTTITAFTIDTSNGIINGTAINITLPENTDLSNLTPQITIPQDATITPDSGTAQDFTVPVSYLVTAQDGVTTVNYIVTAITQSAPSNESDILSFSINNVSGVITNTTIELELPTGTDLSNLSPNITISDGATINPTSGTAIDFSGGTVSYVVTAEDGTTQKTYTVTVTAETPPSTEADILTFTIGDSVGVVNDTNVAITVPFGSNISNLSPTITISQGATIDPLSDTAQAFNGIVPTRYTVTAQDGTTTKIYEIFVEVAPNDQATITSFIINGIEGVISGNTIEVTLPDGTDLSKLTPEITVSENASVTPNSGELQDFSGSAPVNYEVTAQDGTTKQVYEVTVISNDLLSDANEITSFSLEGQDGTIDNTTNSIAVTVPGTTDLSSLTPQITVSPNASYTPQGAVNFTTNPTNFVVEAQDGTQKTWSVMVTKAPIPVTGVSITDPGISVLEIGDTLPLQSVIIPLDADNTNLTWSSSDEQIITVNANTGLVTAVAAGGPINITVTTEDGGFTDQISLSVNAAASTLADIEEFKINNVLATINGTAIALELPATADLMNLTPIITISDGATIVPGSAELQDFSNSQAQPIPYVVTAEDGVTTKTYNVTVTKEVVLSSENDILNFEIDGSAGVVGTNTVNITVPFGSDLSNLTPTITVSPNATVDPPSGQSNFFNGITPTQYTVTAEDGTPKVYTINVGVAPDTRSDENDITAFSITNQVGSANINATNHTVSVTMPFGTNVTTLNPNITVSPNATISPTGVQNFTTPLTYAVTAENETTQNWIVTVNIAPDTRSDENDILTFAISGQEGSSNINPTAHTVTVTMPFDTNLTALNPMITVSSNATINPTGTQNFSTPFTYTITAENETPQNWIVTVNLAPDTRSDENDILTFAISNQIGTTEFSETNPAPGVTIGIINVLMPFGTDRTVLTPDITISPLATISPTGPQNFANGQVDYIVTAENGNTKTWIVQVGNQNYTYDTMSKTLTAEPGIPFRIISSGGGAPGYSRTITAKNNSGGTLGSATAPCNPGVGNCNDMGSTNFTDLTVPSDGIVKFDVSFTMSGSGGGTFQISVDGDNAFGY